MRGLWLSQFVQQVVGSGVNGVMTPTKSYHSKSLRSIRQTIGRFLRVWPNLLFALLGLSLLPIHAAKAQTEAQAASGPPFHIAVLVNSGSVKPCYDNGVIAAIEKMTSLAQEEINKAGGVNGRPIEVRLIDDEDLTEKTIVNVREALKDKQLLGIIGLSNDFTARAVFASLRDELEQSKIPFVTSISDNTIFNGLTNVFSTEPSRQQEGLPIIAAFIQHLKMSHVGFVGLAGSDESEDVGNQLLSKLGFDNLLWDIQLKRRSGRLDAAQLAEAVKLAGQPMTGKNGKEQPTSMLVVDLQRDRAGQFIKALMDARVTPGLFITGDINEISKDIVNNYPNAIYQLAWDELPEVYNNRLLELVGEEKPDQGLFAGRLSLERLPEVYENRMKGLVGNERQHQWVFTDKKRLDSPGWQNGACKERQLTGRPNPLEPDNMRAIMLGAQNADLVAMIATAARKANGDMEIADRRAAIVKEFIETYADGKGAFKGRLRNWSFVPDKRTATRRPLITILPRGLGRLQLAPVQFARVRNQKLRQIDTLYLDIDLVRAHSIDDNRKSFLADFYVAMRGSQNAKIENIEFANAYIDPRTGGRQLSIDVLHAGGPSDVYPSTMRIYRVSGRFLFKPKLANYPFDSQQFSLELQPKSGKLPFIVQPPPLELRDKDLVTDSWIQRQQYVGYSADFIPVVDAFTHEPSVVPFYTASFTWKMKRETTDYFLRVVVPLAFILIVAYLSIFIPQSHLEAIVTIQITALLSAVALYLSLPKLESESATISDRIFVFDYMMVSFMIVISILRINQRIAKRKWLDGMLSFIHIFIIPVVVLLMIFSVYQVSSLQA